MAEKEQGRLSAAQELDPRGLQGTSLEGTQPASSEFNRSAANENQRAPEQGSQQVGKSAAAPRVKPPHELDRAGAAGAHREAMAKDDLAAKLSPRQMAVYEAAQERMAMERGAPSPAQGLDR